jgi:hypothetical protein
MLISHDYSILAPCSINIFSGLMTCLAIMTLLLDWFMTLSSLRHLHGLPSVGLEIPFHAEASQMRNRHADASAIDPTIRYATM